MIDETTTIQIGDGLFCADCGDPIEVDSPCFGQCYEDMWAGETEAAEREREHYEMLRQIDDEREAAQFYHDNPDALYDDALYPPY